MPHSSDTALERLLRQTRQSVLHLHNRSYRKKLPASKGFKLYSPLLYNLRRCFYSHSAKRRRRRRRTMSNHSGSSKELGIVFHRHVYHSTECSQSQCSCRPKTRQPRQGSALDLALKQREAFLKDYKLTPLASEVIVSSESLNLATAVDELAWQHESVTGRRRLFLISWKTGYASGATRSRSRKGQSTKLKGRSLKHVVNSEEAHHQLQLLAEERLLRENGVVPDVSLVVYVLRSSGYYVERLREESFWESEKLTQRCWREFSSFCKRNISTRVVAQPRDKRKKRVRVLTAKNNKKK